MPLNQLPKYVVSEKGEKHPRAVTSGSKKQIMVLACASAAGYILCPLVIFSRKSLNQELTIGEVPGTMYGLTESGWMDGEVFDNWFTHHFLVHAPPLRPLLLLIQHITILPLSEKQHRKKLSYSAFLQIQHILCNRWTRECLVL